MHSKRDHNAAFLADDTGSVSVETAWGIGMLVVVAGIILSAMSAVGAQLTAIDQAGAAARSYAMGMNFTPEVGEIRFEESDGFTTAIATVPTVFGTMSAEVVFPTEDVSHG